MRPLKGELDALRTVLMTPLEEFISDKESESHKDPESLAQMRMFTKAIESVDEARGARLMHNVVLRFGSGKSPVFLSYGPYSTKAQAERALEEQKKLHGPSGWAITAHRSPEGLEQLIAELDKAPEPARQNKLQEKHRLAELNACIHKDRRHLRAGHKEIKSLGNVWDIRNKEGLE